MIRDMDTENISSPATSLKGQLLLAMPNMGDPRFHKAVIFMCSDNSQGSMGITLNQVMPDMTLGDLFDELKVEAKFANHEELPVRHGGPVDNSRGFILHTQDYDSAETIHVDDRFSVTGTVEILKSIANGDGPRQAIFALGYAGWGKGQLAQEILDNAWLVVEADYELVFNTDMDELWDRAMSRHGIDPSRLSGFAGHA